MYEFSGIDVQCSDSSNSNFSKSVHPRNAKNDGIIIIVDNKKSSKDNFKNYLNDIDLLNYVEFYTNSQEVV